jgi:hypothetical protein
MIAKNQIDVAVLTNGLAFSHATIFTEMSKIAANLIPVAHSAMLIQDAVRMLSQLQVKPGCRQR